jgi:2-polyprenyl-3-methyl-5-hydroxy-6-metoxy-1,4-benzoquinol methylase|tara:strand:- start:485 stop:1264 length:780 start_codon:yes stop_codon:yes gene_type:complete
MKKNYDKIIKKHYDKIAQSTKLSAKSTMGDKHTRLVETNFILNVIKKRVKKNFKILDIGCGNAFTLSQISKLSKKYKLTGYEPNEMLRNLAKKRLRKKANIMNVNIRDYKNYNTKYDLIICQRVIINILNAKDQKKALQNIIKLSKKNTIFIFIEAFTSGLQNLNVVRKKVKLSKMMPAYHNKYLSDNFFNNKNIKKIQHDNENILSSHYLVTRILHPIYLKGNNEKFKFNSSFVNFFNKILPMMKTNYSQLKFLIYRR